MIVQPHTLQSYNRTFLDCITSWAALPVKSPLLNPIEHVVDLHKRRVSSENSNKEYNQKVCCEQEINKWKNYHTNDTNKFLLLKHSGDNLSKGDVKRKNNARQKCVDESRRMVIKNAFYHEVFIVIC